MNVREAYLEPSRASTNKLFLQNSSIIDARMGSKYASVFCEVECLEWIFS